MPNSQDAFRCVCSVLSRSCVSLVQLCVIASIARCQFAFAFFEVMDARLPSVPFCKGRHKVAYLIQERRQRQLFGRCVQDSCSVCVVNPLRTHVSRCGNDARLDVCFLEPLLLGHQAPLLSDVLDNIAGSSAVSLKVGMAARPGPQGQTGGSPQLGLLLLVDVRSVSRLARRHLDVRTALNLFFVRRRRVVGLPACLGPPVSRMRFLWFMLSLGSLTNWNAASAGSRSPSRFQTLRCCHRKGHP